MNRMQLIAYFIWGGYHGLDHGAVRDMVREAEPCARIGDADLRNGMIEGARLKRMGVKCDGPKECPVCLRRAKTRRLA